MPPDQGALAALEALLAHHRAPQFDDLPPFHGGVVGYLGYDVVREVERLRTFPPDPVGLARRRARRSPGHVTAFDHFRQRLFLIENVFVDRGMGDDDLDAAYAARG